MPKQLSDSGLAGGEGGALTNDNAVMPVSTMERSTVSPLLDGIWVIVVFC